MKKRSINIHRILLVRLSALGDCLAAIPVFMALRKRFPHAHIAWVIQDNFAPLIRHLPGLDELIIFPRSRWRKMQSRWRLWREAASLARRLWRRRFDVTIDVQSNTKSAILAFLTHAPLRIGHGKVEAKEISRWFTNCPIDPPADCTHVLQRNLHLLSPLGIDRAEPEFSLPPDHLANRAITSWLQDHHLLNENYVILVPFCGNRSKEWPYNHYTALAALLAERQIPVVFLQGPGKKDETATLIPDRNKTRIHLGPPTTISEMVELIRHAGAIVGGDTGPVQIAGALGVKSVGLFGPTDPERSHPWRASAIHDLDSSPERIYQTIQSFFE